MRLFRVFVEGVNSTWKSKHQASQQEDQQVIIETSLSQLKQKTLETTLINILTLQWDSRFKGRVTVGNILLLAVCNCHKQRLYFNQSV